MAVKKLNLSSFLKRVAVKMSELVRRDSQKSTWQDGKKGGKYSKQYKFYKSRGMIGIKGERLKGFKGIHTNQNVARVNMKLTGAMENSLKGTKFTKDSFVMRYDNIMAGRIIGNQERGRDVVGLNDKNEKIILGMYTRELVKYFRMI